MDVMKALHEWKKGGRGETMMSTFEYKSSHDKMFLEGFREAECYLEEENVELKKSYNDLFLQFNQFVQFNQLHGRHEWHNLKENPDDLPPAQDYESEGSIDHWKWYLVKTDYTDYKSCQYAICARVLMPRYSDGVDEPIWKENSGNDIGDEHIFEWRAL